MRYHYGIVHNISLASIHSLLYDINPLQGRGVNWLHFAIRV